MNRCFQFDDLRILILRPLRVVAIALPLLCGGCLALNIPSVRYADPDDHGGLFGPQRKKGQAVTAAIDQSHNMDGDCSLGEHGCRNASFDDSDEVELEKPPEVPWPRFHPLPTRPVFSTPQ